MRFKKVFVLSPHTDDGELGCGGTISKFIEDGVEVHYIAFSAPLEVLKEEVKQALKVYEVENNGVHLHLLNYDRRTFPSHRQDILQSLYDLNNEYKPDLVFTPSTYDLHQDHETVTNEAKRVFKDSSIFGYILRWNCQIIKEDIFIPLDERDINKKINSLGAYHSQFKLRSKYFNPSFHLNEARVRGLNYDKGFAEAFEIIRLELI
jgi:LmbE family N-acetylglucosaminyl deacetylase